MRSLRYTAIPKPKVASTKNKPALGAWCGQCHEPIDVGTLLAKTKMGERYVHPCGRVLARGDGPPNRDAPHVCHCGGADGEHLYSCSTLPSMTKEEAAKHVADAKQRYEAGFASEDPLWFKEWAARAAAKMLNVSPYLPSKQWACGGDPDCSTCKALDEEAIRRGRPLAPSRETRREKSLPASPGMPAAPDRSSSRPRWFAGVVTGSFERDAQPPVRRAS